MKSILRSKTIWAAAIYAALIAIDSPLSGWLKAHSGIHAIIALFVFTFLRVITSSALGIPWKK